MSSLLVDGIFLFPRTLTELRGLSDVTGEKNTRREKEKKVIKSRGEREGEEKTHQKFPLLSTISFP